MAHTPGPWKDDVTEDGTLIVSFGEQCGAYSRDIEFGDMENTEGEDHANARLIAAAPDLLEALEVLAEDFRVTIKMHIGFWNTNADYIPGGHRWTYDPTECSSYKTAMRIIAKARGDDIPPAGAISGALDGST